MVIDGSVRVGSVRKTHMLLVRLIVGIAASVAIVGVLLLVPAGESSLGWWRAWVFLGMVIAGAIGRVISLLPGHKGLLGERLQSPLQKGQPLGDKVLVLLFLASIFVFVAFIPADVFRWHVFPKPSTLVSSLGLLLFVGGWWIVTLALRQNAFAAPVVKIQRERQQRVIDTGLYGIVRHPMYAGAVLAFVGMPVWLESYAAALLAVAPAGLIVVRVFVEERLLRRELEGYEAYTHRVRYRLIPFLW
jgi:protein-S-isoprenylcysteine O-methyltransferase Ste14